MDATRQRQTKQLSTIREIFAHTERALSPQEILAASRKQVKQLGLATVYRTLKTLEDNGEIHSVNLPGQSPRFERSGKGHHHHFSCKNCGQVFHLSCPGKHESLPLPKGFKLERQEVLLYGRCDKCNNPQTLQTDNNTRVA